MNLTIDGQSVEVAPETTILEATREIGVHIPTLCAYHELNHFPGACRVCVVEVDRSRNLVASCVTPVAEGMVVKTNTERVRRSRRSVIEMLLSDHPADCTTCRKHGHCELQTVAEQVGVNAIRLARTVFDSSCLDSSSAALVRDPSKCINCLRCVTVCSQMQSVNLLTPEGRGFSSRVVPALNTELADAACTYCGQCVQVCPTGALTERDDTQKVWDALEDPDKHVVVQAAPAIRATLGEEFGLPAGSLVTGLMIAVLRHMGFDRVFDTNFTADLTIMEEGHELLGRLRNGGKLPMLTSCCPAWIKFMEHFYTDHLDHLSSCKSPQQMFGAVAKTYYSQYSGIDPENIFVVSVMPCTAKKFEATRPEMCASGYRDVDAVLTTRELGRMVRQVGINFEGLSEELYDPPLGAYSGAGTIFGATGGVMEAALRTVQAVVTGQQPEVLDITPLRGLERIKEAKMEVGELGEVRVAVAHGLSQARHLMEEVVAGKSPYHFIEFMACPGGCVGGGGQPVPVGDARRHSRASALYRDDKEIQTCRLSHENPALQELYRKFLHTPNGELCHQLLHTHYTPREV